MDLGTVDLTRFILISKSPALRKQSQKLYDDHFAANVKALLDDQASK